MELILFAMISLVVVVALLASRLNDNSFPFPFDKKNTVFTAAEKNFQVLLEQALGPKFRVLNRVKLSDIISIRNGVSQKTSQVALKNANNKYLDFAICDRETMKLCGTLDLVDTNGKGYKVKKDWFVSGALEAASIPHVRIKVKNTYTLEEIRACINTRLLANIAPTPKVAGRIIPATMVRARSKNTGVVAAPAIPHKPHTNPANQQLVEQLKAARPAALTH
ncbi:MAG: DUF2726 domain-containing protein [Thalassotalea sp.]